MMTTQSQSHTPSLPLSLSPHTRSHTGGPGGAGPDADLRVRLCWLHSLFAAGEAGL